MILRPNGNWIVQGSKYATQGFPQMQLVRSWPEALYGKNKDNKSLVLPGRPREVRQEIVQLHRDNPGRKGLLGQAGPTDGHPHPGTGAEPGHVGVGIELQLLAGRVPPGLPGNRPRPPHGLSHLRRMEGPRA